MAHQTLRLAQLIAVGLLAVALSWPELPLVSSAILVVLLVLAVPDIASLGDFRLPTPASGRFSEEMEPEELEEWLSDQESALEPIKATVEKSIVWANPSTKARTEYVIVTLHGWSASSRELRPMDLRLAEELGANVYRHRLTGHGLLPLVRSGKAMDELAPEDLFLDAIEAFNAGRVLGNQIIFLASSTGAALATWVCSQSWSKGVVAGVVFNSPAYALVPRSTWPVVRRIFRYCPGWLSVFIAERSINRPFLPRGTLGFEPYNEENQYFWTHRYPVSALRNLFDTLWHVDFRSSPKRIAGCIDVPMVVFGNWNDHVVDLRSTHAILEAMGYKHWEDVPSRDAANAPDPDTAVPFDTVNDDKAKSPGAILMPAAAAGKHYHTRVRPGVDYTQKQLLYTMKNSNHSHIIISDVFNPHLIDEAVEVTRRFWHRHLGN